MSALHIAVDPGFDSMKIVANGIAFKFPYNVIETDERKMHDFNLRGDFLLYKDEKGRTFRVGQYARELVYEQKDRQEEQSLMESFYTEQRFTSGTFLVALRTAVALAMKKTGLTKDPDIYMMIALPHSYRDQFAPAVTGAAAGVHRFFLTLGKGKEEECTFTIKENKVFTVSQTIAAVLGETSDSKGNIDEKKFYYLSNGPTLVCDGGYYTMGIVELSKGGSVDDDKTESDTAHAMRNINMLVAEEVQKVRPEVQHYIIEYLLSQNGGIIKYLDKDGKAAILDLNKLHREKGKLVCDDLIQHLNQKYNNLLDINYALITGGTGMVFFKQLQSYYEKIGILDAAHMLLSSCELDKSKLSIEFAIALGAYKGLLGFISK